MSGQFLTQVIKTNVSSVKAKLFIANFFPLKEIRCAVTKQHGRQYTNLNEFTSPAYLMTFMTSVVQISALKTKPYKYMFVDETKSR